jgi:hypothetical protein
MALIHILGIDHHHWFLSIHGLFRFHPDALAFGFQQSPAAIL